jgi:hypothetical protein
MKRIEPNIPGGRVTYNYLYRDMPIDWREEDLLFASLPDGKTIDVGWYPACDPDGLFRITLSNPDQTPVDVMRTPDIDQMVRAVESLASQSRQESNPIRTCSIVYVMRDAFLPFNANNSTSTTYWPQGLQPNPAQWTARATHG